MKKTLLALSSTLVFILLLVSTYNNELMSNTGAPPAGYTGSPGDGRTCTNCHNGTASNVAGWITSNIPASGYVPGQTYTITATATQANCVKFGFEISPQKTNGTRVGTLVVTNSTETQVISQKYIGHRSAGTAGSGGSKTWSFSWVAPTAGTGSFVFYGSFNASNNNSSDGGDKIYHSTLAVDECSYSPQITSNTGNTTSCGGQALTLTVPDASTFKWSNNATTSQITAASSGSYSVTATSATGCPGTAAATVTVSNLTISEAHVNTTCGQNNGSITLSVNGGVQPYTFAWNNTATTQNLTGIAAGNYNVVVTDAVGCSKSLGVTITATAPPTLTVSHINSTCLDFNGSATSIVSGGTLPYTYKWNNGATTKDVIGLGPGSYSVTVTDVNACSDAAFITIQTTIPPTLIATPTNTTCNNSNGSISLSVTGGTAPYSYLWNNNKTTKDLQNLFAGTYAVTVTDGGSCNNTKTITLTNSAPPVLATTTSNSSCGKSNGDVKLTVTGGTTPYQYLWSNNTTLQNLNNVLAATYNVTVTDANNCTATTAATINNIAGPSQMATTATNAKCNLNNGSITSSVTGGTQPYLFSWSTGATTPAIDNLAPDLYYLLVTDAYSCSVEAFVMITKEIAPTATTQTTAATCNTSNGTAEVIPANGKLPYAYSWNNGATSKQITGLTAGTYTATVTDGNGCTVKTDAVITTTFPPTLTNTHIQPTCGAADGSITIKVTGGVAPYTYFWNNGSTTFTVTNMAQGTYTYTVTDANTCSSAITVTLNNAQGPVATLTTTNETCTAANGAIDLTINGGTSPYTYSWSSGQTVASLINITAGEYKLTITDQNGCISSSTASIINAAAPVVVASVKNASCGLRNGGVKLLITSGTEPFSYNWSNSASTPELTNLSQNNYAVTVTDDNGCTAKATSIVDSIPPFKITTEKTNTTCGQANGTINLTVTDGSTPYAFAWSNGATNILLTRLTAGDYIFTVTDADQCTSSGIVNINGSIGIELSKTHVRETCSASNGSVAIEVLSGTAPYNYLWNNGQTTASLTNIKANAYAINVSDDNGCTANLNIIITNAAAPQVSSSGIDATCGHNDGSITLFVNGSTPFIYSWNNSATTNSIENITGGIYSYTVTDVNNCSTIGSDTVSGSSKTLLTETHTHQSCNNIKGSVNLTATDGIPPYTYRWNNGQTTEDITNLNAGNYIVTVTDSSLCISTTSITIEDKGTPVINTIITNTTCGQENGSVITVIDGGVEPLSFTWNNGQTTQSVIGLAAGSYSVSVSDVNGCSSAKAENINSSSEPVKPELSVSGNVITVVNSNAFNEFHWFNGSDSLSNATESVYIVFVPGVYTVVAENEEGCSASASVDVQTGIEEIDAEDNLVIYPNPASNTIYVEDGNGNSTIEIYSAVGSLLSTNEVNGKDAIDISNLPQGIYIMAIHKKDKPPVARRFTKL